MWWLFWIIVIYTLSFIITWAAMSYIAGVKDAETVGDTIYMIKRSGMMAILPISLFPIANTVVAILLAGVILVEKLLRVIER